MRSVIARRQGRPRGVKSIDTRERILSAARTIFGELGYHATTFQAIAEHAGLTRPAINHYFSNKKLLYGEVLERTISVHVNPALERARHEPDLIGRLSSFMVAMDQVNAEDRSAGAFVVAAMLEAKRHPELLPAVAAAQLTAREFLTWAVADAIACGELSADAEVPSLVEMLSAVLWGQQFYATFVGDDHQVSAMSANLRLLLAGKLWQIGS